jgi:hypothetical protein
MLQIRRIIQLLSNGCTIRTIKRITSIHRLTISQYAERTKNTGKDIAELVDYPDTKTMVAFYCGRGMCFKAC